MFGLVKKQEVLNVLDNERRYYEGVYADLLKQEKSVGLMESEVRYKNKVSCTISTLIDLRFKIDHFVK